MMHDLAHRVRRSIAHARDGNDVILLVRDEAERREALNLIVNPEAHPHLAVVTGPEIRTWITAMSGPPKRRRGR